MNRRRFLGILGGTAAALALPPIMVSPERRITPDLTLSLEEFQDRYIRPAVEVCMKAFENQLLDNYPSMGRISGPQRLHSSDWQHLDPARLPL